MALKPRDDFIVRFDEGAFDFQVVAPYKHPALHVAPKSPGENWTFDVATNKLTQDGPR